MDLLMMQPPSDASFAADVVWEVCTLKGQQGGVDWSKMVSFAGVLMMETYYHTDKAEIFSRFLWFFAPTRLGRCHTQICKLHARKVSSCKARSYGNVPVMASTAHFHEAGEAGISKISSPTHASLLQCQAMA
eukprot:3117145-Amphidinium_carterae.1